LVLLRYSEQFYFQHGGRRLCAHGQSIQ
jgi:hypothetical protein